MRHGAAESELAPMTCREARERAGPQHGLSEAEMRKVVLKMSISLDSFVCGPNGEVDWIFRTVGGDSTEWVVGRHSWICWRMDRSQASPPRNSLLSNRTSIPEERSASQNPLGSLRVLRGAPEKHRVRGLRHLRATLIGMRGRSSQSLPKRQLNPE